MGMWARTNFPILLLICLLFGPIGTPSSLTITSSGFLVDDADDGVDDGAEIKGEPYDEFSLVPDILIYNNDNMIKYFNILNFIIEIEHGQ